MPIKKLSLAIAAMAMAATTAFAQAPSARIRGTVEKLEAGVATVKTTDGQSVTLKRAPNLAISAVVKLSASEIKPGSFIGAGARPMADGSLSAIQINVFPEAQRGTGEGHRDWAAMPQTTMTNATVAQLVKDVDGQTITLKYKDGEKKIVVTGDTVIVTYVPGTKDELKPGAKIFVAGARKLDDGTLEAAAISVGRDGLTPPM